MPRLSTASALAAAVHCAALLFRQLDDDFAQPDTMACVLRHFGNNYYNVERWLRTHQIAVKVGCLTVNQTFISVLGNTIVTILLVSLVVSVKLLLRCNGTAPSPLCQFLEASVG